MSVEQQLPKPEHLPEHDRAEASPVVERLLVCVSPSALSERLVRATGRLANELNAEWFALHVETPEQARLSAEGRNRVARHLQLAEELGGTTATRTAASVAEAVVGFAREHDVTKTIVGRPLRSRWAELLRGSIADQIIRQSGPIGTYVISGSTERPEQAQAPAGRRLELWQHYLQSVLLVLVATLLGWPVQIRLDPTNLVLLYLTAVVVAALYLGRGPAVLASVLSVLALDYFFVPPRLRLVVDDPRYLLTFAGLLIVGLVISTLAAQAHAQIEASRRRQAETAALCSLSQALVAAEGLEAALQAVISHVRVTFGCAAAVLMPRGEALTTRAASPDLILREDELAVATWAFEQGQPAGEGTDNLPSGALRWLPLKTAGGVVGVLGVKVPARDSQLTPDQRRLLETFANYAALAIERA